MKYEDDMPSLRVASTNVESIPSSSQLLVKLQKVVFHGLLSEESHETATGGVLCDRRVRAFESPECNG